MEDRDFFGRDDIILFLDIIVVLMLEEAPILGLVFVALLKTVTHEVLPRLALIILIIVMSIVYTEDEEESEDEGDGNPLID
ncbi:hypothetical protein [Alkalihalobacillus sp. 1P02AB]|uniref:hypothetical protein n=1 Tax=Alkalihalobacillus sp. 1P02AB TaxID=3132260 RepID=UPI0039A57E78